MTRRPLNYALFVFSIGAAAVWEASAFSSYRTAEDNATSALAVQRAAEECGKVDLGNIDHDEAREALKGTVGERNVILEALVAANSSAEFQENLEQEISPGKAIQVAGPLVFSIILAVVWLICCWTACPFCKRCRCGAKQRKTEKWVRLIVLGIVVALLLGMVVCAMAALGGKDNFEDGFTSVSCTAARVVDFTLNGNSEQQFLGMLPLLDRMGMLRSILNDGSSFLSSLYTIMDDTEEIERATYVAEQTMALLGSTAGLPANVNPLPSQAPERTLHRCALCVNLDEPLQELSATLADSVAKSLAAAREEVDQQLSAENRLVLQSTLDSAVTPLREAASTVRDSTGFFLQDDFKDLKESITSYGGAGIILGAVLVFLVGACGGTSSGLCTFKEHDQAKADDGINPWNKHVAPCACCTWCSGWFYAFLVFFVGGMMIVVSVLLSSLCLVMDSVDSQLLKQMLPGVGVNMDPSSSEFLMITDIIDTCFSRMSPATDRTFMDILFVEENGTRVTLKQKIQGQTVDMMKEQFAAVDEQLATAPPRLMDNQDLIDLLTLLRDTPVDTAINAQPELLQFSRYTGLQQDPRGSSGGIMQAAIGSSLACNDAIFGGATVVGLTNLTARMAGFTSGPLLPTPPASSCAGVGKVTCNRHPGTGVAHVCPALGDPVCAACESANDLIDLKADLLGLNNFRCDIFQTASGGDCDPKDMQLVAGVWQNDCIQTSPNGAPFVSVKQKTCTLAEFKVYMADWHVRLTKVFTRLDDAVPAVQDSIVTDLQRLINVEMVLPVGRMVNETQCRFLKAEYSSMVAGFCFKGVLGFDMVARAYVANGVLTVLLIIVTYAIWRRSVDNRNKWKEANTKVEPGTPVIAGVVKRPVTKNVVNGFV